MGQSIGFGLSTLVAAIGFSVGVGRAVANGVRAVIVGRQRYREPVRALRSVLEVVKESGYTGEAAYQQAVDTTLKLLAAGSQPPAQPEVPDGEPQGPLLDAMGRLITAFRANPNGSAAGPAPPASSSSNGSSPGGP